MPHSRWLERSERRIYTEQEQLIRETCGVMEACNANYGWGVDASETHISVATKVYGHGILTSNKSFGESIQHTWSEL